MTHRGHVSKALFEVLCKPKCSRQAPFFLFSVEMFIFQFRHDMIQNYWKSFFYGILQDIIQNYWKSFAWHSAWYHTELLKIICMAFCMISYRIIENHLYAILHIIQNYLEPFGLKESVRLRGYELIIWKSHLSVHICWNIYI